MISSKLQDAINEQINKELYSEYLYFSMAAYLERIGLPGFSIFMRVQAQEEHAHAVKFYDYLLERQGKIVLKAIDAPEVDFESPQEIFEKTYEHEQYVTGLINNLMTISIKENDYAAQSFLKWFIDEQVEEEASMDKVLAQLKLVSDDGKGMYLLDKELGTRVFTPPV
ncbi:MAG: ferritin [Kiritimatiellae bacterium]|jgi:ferritin|nr:ferritin [Kiritimatiellia bacterium]